ncbi:hypothetical protein SDC9_62726 [bioreactor metagenome]|uniref:Uncharacterized protein n=1 Tax=bioreactor metagenome TaxID=1076179 RepID=A0A644XKR4_9ZZZZ
MHGNHAVRIRVRADGNDLIALGVRRQLDLGSQQDRRIFRVNRYEQVACLRLRIADNKVERRGRILVHRPVARSCGVLCNLRRVVDRLDLNRNSRRVRAALSVAHGISERIRSVVVRARRIEQVGAVPYHSTVRGSRIGFHAQGIVLHIRIVAEYVDGNRVVFIDRLRVGNGVRRVVHGIDRQRCACARARAVFVHDRIVEGDLARIVAVCRNGNGTVAVVGDCAVGYVFDLNNLERGVFHIRIVGGQVHSRGRLARGRIRRFGDRFVNRLFIVHRNGRVVDRNDFELECAFRSEFPVAGDNGNQRRTVGIVVRHNRNFHLFAADVRNRNALDEVFVVRSQRVVRGARKVVIHVVHRKQHFRSGIFIRSLIIIKVFDLRLVVDGDNMDRCRLACAELSRRLIRDRVGKRIVAIEVRIRMVHDDTAGENLHFAVSGAVAFENSKCDRIAVHLAVRAKHADFNGYIFIGCRVELVDARRVVHRRNR